MTIRDYLGALIIVCASLSAAYGQETAASSLQEAERALEAALERHDRPAFVAMFAPDAECTLPSVAHGPEAIANLWLPFLIDPGTTLILTATEVVTAQAGDTGTTSGTFAIRGRTPNGIQTIPGGTYSIGWRVIDGRWKISTLGGSGNGARKTPDLGGVGPFRFGMTRGEVSGVVDCRPYTSVAVTGGLECPHYSFDARTMNISFLFAADRLSRIQLWYYEGESSQEARDAVGRVLDFLQRTAGGAVVRSRPGMPVTTDGVMSIMNGTPPAPGRIAQLEISGASCEQSEIWFSRVGRHEHGYLVMLFADPRPGQ
jgi:ketosteroid isomerase-like protein